MKRSTIGTTLALVFGLALLPATGASATTAPFAYTGGEQTFSVPADVHTVHIVAIGAQGAGNPGTLGGAGAVMGGDVAVSPGQILYIEVGGVGSARSSGGSPGGFNGGGSSGGGAGGGDTYGGGGGSDLRSAPRASADSLASRLVVAGGGGGASNTAGGAAGSAGSGTGGGGPGTSSSGGAGGGGATGDGQFGVGGSGAVSATGKGGGGGGGGYFGGGGGGPGSSGYGGGGGGSSFSVSGGSFTLDTSGVPSVTITYTAASQHGGQNQTTTPLALASGLTFSNKTFAAEASGPSAYTVRRKAPLGTKVSVKLNEAATVRFTVTQGVPGRKVKRGKKTVCVKPTKTNRKRKRCTRTITLKGSFSRNGATGKNSFHFTGRLNGRKLKPGRYRLVASPTAGGKKGKPTSTSFRILLRR